MTNILAVNAFCVVEKGASPSGMRTVSRWEDTSFGNIYIYVYVYVQVYVYVYVCVCVYKRVKWRGFSFLFLALFFIHFYWHILVEKSSWLFFQIYIYIWYTLAFIAHSLPFPLLLFHSRRITSRSIAAESNVLACTRTLSFAFSICCSGACCFTSLLWCKQRWA